MRGTENFCKPMGPAPGAASDRASATTRAKAMPSGDSRVDRLFRIAPSDGPADGVTIPPPGEGVLVRFSVAAAHRYIKTQAEQRATERRAKLGRR